MGKGSDENISVGKDGTDGYDIEVRKYRYEKEEKRKENNLRLFQRPEA